MLEADPERLDRTPDPGPSRPCAGVGAVPRDGDRAATSTWPRSSVSPPTTADAYHLRALAAEDATEAIALLDDRALAIDPAHAEALYERSSRHAERKDFGAALRDADRLIVVRPRSAQGRRLAGRLYVDQHDIDRALEQFAEALRIDPDDPITLNERARLYRALARHEEAFADLNRAILLDPDYAGSYHERAQLQSVAEPIRRHRRGRAAGRSRSSPTTPTPGSCCSTIPADAGSSGRSWAS